MHRSNSIDYGILLSGELELEGGSVARLAPGDIVVQRGTNHLRGNRSRCDWCRICFHTDRGKGRTSRWAGFT